MPLRFPKPRDSEAKLQYIILQAAQLFAEQGYEGTSIRDISRATGVSLSGLYYYFESKQKLLYLIQINAFTSVLQRLRSRLAGVSDPQLRLRILIQNHVEYFLSHPNEMRVLSHEEHALEDPFKQEIADIKRRYYTLAHDMLDELARDGSMPALNPRIAVLSLFGMMNWIYKWHNPKVDPATEELTEVIFTIFLRGVLAPNGAAREAQAIEARVLQKV